MTIKSSTSQTTIAFADGYHAEEEIRRVMRIAEQVLALENKRPVLSLAKLRAFGCSDHSVRRLANEWEIKE